MNLFKQRDFIVYFLTSSFFAVLILTNFVDSQEDKSFEAAESNLQSSIQTVLSDFRGQGNLKMIDHGQKDRKPPTIKSKRKLIRNKKIQKKCRKLSRSLNGMKNTSGRKIW
jgi:hypothetical protein